MARDTGINGEPESAGGVGPPGSLSRRRLLQGAAAAGLTLSATQLETSTADASDEVVVSWQTYAAVESPRVYLGTLGRGLRSWPVAATTTGYVDPKEPNEPVFVHSARLTGLRPDRVYFYVAVHEGADPEGGGFRTAPRGRAVFTFTSFGDQGTPTLIAPTNLPAPAPKYANDNLGSPAAGDVTEGVEKVAPLFHLVNGDLCYANLSTVPVRTWSDWFAFNSRSHGTAHGCPPRATTRTRP